MDDDLDLSALAGAAGMGAVAGLRSMMAPALLAQAARTGSIELKNGQCAFLGTQKAADIATGLAVAELVVDKLPSTPARTAPFGLAGRAVSGAIVGAAVCSARRKNPGPGAVVGALAAIGAAFIGYTFRKKFPGLVPAVLEDAATVGLAVAVLRCEADARAIAE
jgi:uncharacterized membrane protein